MSTPYNWTSIDDDFEDDCDDCGRPESSCDCEELSGYECAECGYEPTWRETHRGTCPECREMNR